MAPSKAWLCALLLVCLTARRAGASRPLPAPETSADNRPIVQGEVLIQYSAGVSESKKSEVLGRILAQRLERVADTPAGELVRAKLPPGLAVAAAVEALKPDRESGAVQFAEPNFIYTTQGTADPTDTYYKSGDLWGMMTPDGVNNKGGSNASAAWNAGYTGAASAVIGVVDEGIMYYHEDLGPDNIWKNPGETSSTAAWKKDDDGNGYIDDIYGWDFANGDNTTFDSNGDDHATHVAGTIGGIGNNAKGIVGVNWNVKMISAKFLGSRGGTTANAIKAIDYITDLKTRHGKPIVASSNSWGGGGFSQGLQDAITRAGSANILFIAAAGNGGSDQVGDNNDVIDNYPSNYPNDNVIAVAAIDKLGSLAGFSNYGATTVDLGAPGVGIMSSVPLAKPPGSKSAPYPSGYASYSGTSMATPHVSGAAALYASACPNAKALEIKAAIMATAKATPNAALTGKSVTGGQLNVGLLMEYAVNTKCGTVSPTPAATTAAATPAATETTTSTPTDTPTDTPTETPTTAP